MKRQLYKIALSIVTLGASAFGQDSTIVHEGIQIRVIDSYKTMSSVFQLDAIQNFFATAQGRMSVGTSLGYRFYGKASIDASLDASYIRSTHHIQNQYPATLSIQTSTDRIDLDILSLDLSLYFFADNRIQPYVRLGYDIYLNTIHFQADGYNAAYNIPYHSDNSYSVYGLHAELGVGYYLTNNIIVNGFIREGANIYNSVKIPAWNDNTFAIHSIEYGDSFSFLF